MIRTSFPDLVTALSASPADAPFVTMWHSEDETESVTFGDFRRWAAAQAAVLSSRGVSRGDRIVIVLPQGIELMSCFAGAMMLGAIPAVLAYPNFKVEPAKYRKGLSGVTANLRARVIILDESFPPDLLPYIESVGVTLMRSVARSPEADAVVLPEARIVPADVAFIQHSAGTTGLQKGVALSHAAVLRQIRDLVPTLGLTDSDRIYSWLPLYHDMGLIACFILPMVLGLPVVMQSPTAWVMQPETMLDVISHYRCSLAWIPNFTLQFLGRRARADGDWDLSCIRALINCSEPVRAESMDTFFTAFKNAGARPEMLQSSYAMAENVFAVTQSKFGSPLRRVWVDRDLYRTRHIAAEIDKHARGAICFVSSGSCLAGNEVRIVSESGQVLDAGHVGEIHLRSDSLFDGYFNRPDLTQRVLRDGWYATGDLGFTLGPDLFVVGRKTDLIIVGGKNIYPQDVEELVGSHPDIHDGRVVAIGAYDIDLGTDSITVIAELEVDSRVADAPAIERAVRAIVLGDLGVTIGRLFLKPRGWIVKSTAGKPARGATREKLAAEHPELRHDA